MATLESTAFFALGFGAVNGQDFRTRRNPPGRFTLFLMSQLVSGSRVSLKQGRAGPAGVETAGREHGSCNYACGRIEFIYRIKQVCRITTPTCFSTLVVSRANKTCSPTEVLYPNLQPRTKQRPTDSRKANLFTFT